MKKLLSLLLMICVTQHADAQPIAVQVLEFKTDNPDAWQALKLKSDSAPLTLNELTELAQAGIAQSTIIDMMRTRRVLALANPQTLLTLKKAGATDAMIAALSAYAYPPNTSFDLALQIHLVSPNAFERAPYLYVEVWHNDKNRQAAFLRADLRQLIQSSGTLKVERSSADPLLGDNISRLFVSTQVPARHPGAMELRLLATQDGSLTRLTGLTPSIQSNLTKFPIAYPAVSLERRCVVDLTLARDALVKDAYKMNATGLDCRWD